MGVGGATRDSGGDNQEVGVTRTMETDEGVLDVGNCAVVWWGELQVDLD